MDAVRRQALRVGMLTAVSLTIFGVLVFWVGQEQRLFEDKVRYITHFRRTNGLQVGAPVALTGVMIGNVESMEFPEDVDAQYIVVHLRLIGKVAPRIRENSIASVRTLGLLGDKFVELTAGTTEAQPLKPGSVIASLDPIDYEEVLGQSGDIITNVIEVTTSLKTVLQAIDRGEGLLGELVRNRPGTTTVMEEVRTAARNIEHSTATLARLVDRVERGEGVLGALIDDSGRTERILERVEHASTSLARFTLRLQEGSGALPRLLDDEKYAREVLGDVERAAANLAEISEKVNRGEGTLGALVNDPTLYRQVSGVFGGGGAGWLVSLYRGVRNLWPVGDGAHTEQAPPGIGAAGVQPTSPELP